MNAFSPRESTVISRAMGAVARDLLGEPNKGLSSKDELRFGTQGSTSVDLPKGTWFDHEAGQGGGVLDLVMFRRNTDKDGALAWLSERRHIPPAAGLNILARYPYTDADGKLLYEVVRLHPKDFRQRRPDGLGGWVWKMKGVERVIYRLPSVIAAVQAGTVIYVTEGEKSADALAGLGVTATCSPGGAGKWRREYAQHLAGADVVILPDSDEPGRQHAGMVAASLRSMHGGAARVRVLALPDLPEKGDVYDWLTAGGSVEKLAELAEDVSDTGNGALPVSTSAKSSDTYEGFELHEDGVAQAFTEQHAGQLRYCHDTGAWFVWTGQLWRHERTKLAFSWARRTCRELARGAEDKDRAKIAKAAFAAAVERYAQADRAFAVTSETWDVDPWLLGTPAGTVDLRTGQVRPAAQTDYITKSTAIAPAVEADCPRWFQFLDEVTGKDDGLIRFLQQWCGYTLTGVTREHALVFGYGPGGNGKSVLLNTMAGIMGDYARTATMDTFTVSFGEKHSTDLAMLQGARLVSASETEEGRAWAEARIKALTGGDPITARFMRQDNFTFRPAFKLVIVGNHKPVIKNVDDAVRRRFNLVPFLNKPDRPDHKLEDTLKAEWPGILRWMIDGCLDWQDRGLIRPKVVKEATADYFSDQDTLAHWLEDNCEQRADYGDTHASLWASWSGYAKSRGDDPGGAKAFTQALLKRGFSQIKDCKGIRGRGMSGLKVKVYHSSEDAA